MQEVLREVIDARKLTAGTGTVPLLLNMDEATFANAAEALLEAGNDIRLQQFVGPLSEAFGLALNVPDYESVLDKWVIFCAQARFFRREDLDEAATDRLYAVFKAIDVGTDAERKRLAVVIRLYALGSLAVRQEAWNGIHSLVLRPVASNPYYAEYIYSSWIRQAQVNAGRAMLYDNRGGGLISAARELLTDHPAMRPDLDDSAIVPADQVDSNDVLLNSLCGFDMAYCLIVVAEGTAADRPTPPHRPSSMKTACFR